MLMETVIDDDDDDDKNDVVFSFKTSEDLNRLQYMVNYHKVLSVRHAFK
jgi:hypothetical protein